LLRNSRFVEALEFDENAAIFSQSMVDSSHQVVLVAVKIIVKFISTMVIAEFFV
jgi:hypothetical protein